MSTIYTLCFPLSIGISSRTLLLGLLFLSLNSQILHQDHFCNSSYQQHYRLWNLPIPFKPCFQVFSFFSNIIWLSNSQHHVEKQPEKKFKTPRTLNICHSLLVFFVQFSSLPSKKAMEGLDESLLDSQENNLKVREFMGKAEIAFFWESW